MGVVLRHWTDPIVVRRFLAFCKPCKTDHDGKPCTCILFEGTVTNGWGRFVAHGFPECPSGRTQAHRYWYALTRGPIPDGYQLHHSHTDCNHRNCVNGYHLEPIEQAEHGRVSMVYAARESNPLAVPF